MPLPLTVLHENGTQVLDLGTISAGPATLGREPENSIVVDSSKVSRRHGCLISAGSQWLFHDLGSTNGSWLNGVSIDAHGFKLLRDGDLLQLADAKLQTAIAAGSEGEQPTASSLILLIHDEVCDEFLPGEGESFILGGEEGAVPPAECGLETPVLEITYSNDRFELHTSDAAGVMVNGMVANGVTALADRDEILVGDCRILVSNAATVSSGAGRVSSTGFARPEVSSVESPKTTGSHQRREMRDDWESPASRRKYTGGRKFIFGEEIGEAEDDSLSDTGMSGRLPSGSSSGFEMNISQRLPAVSVVEEDPSTQRFSRIMWALGLILAVLIVGLLIFVLFVVV